MCICNSRSVLPAASYLEYGRVEGNSNQGTSDATDGTKDILCL